MKRIFTRMERDEILADMNKLEKEISRLNKKAKTEELSEWEFSTLEMKKLKLRHLRSM